MEATPEAVSNHLPTTSQCSVIFTTNDTQENSFLLPSYMQVSCPESENFGTVNENADHKVDSNTLPDMAVLPLCHIVQLNWVPSGEHIDSVSGEVTDNIIVQSQDPWNDRITSSEEAIVYSETPNQTNDDLPPRTRKKRRSFSPEPIGGSKKVKGKQKGKSKATASDTKILPEEEPVEKPFSCDKCHSSFVVDPSRCRLPPNQLKKKATYRKKIDPISKKTLTLCNACGIAFSKPPKKPKEISSTVTDREKYRSEAVAFAKLIAEKMQNPQAERLYCPAFKNRPCSCIQKYLSEEGKNENSLFVRANNLLEFTKTSCYLRGQKNCNAEEGAGKSEGDSQQNSSKRKLRLRQFEQFILEARQHLRERFRLCELACQRVLSYSNNFLHKPLKSAPDRGSRISRRLGKNNMGHLKPVDELGSYACCSDNCSRLAFTHSTLLEEWRRQAAQGQRQARRVLAEMLTPSGGTKANCYKFIAMVTGCSFTTISSVSHQMRITKGDREPPEHGLKKWYREHPKVKNKPENSSSVVSAEVGKATKNDNGELSSSSSIQTVQAVSTAEVPSLLDITQNCQGESQFENDSGYRTECTVIDILIPNPEDISLIAGPDATYKLEEQKQNLIEAKKQLALKQQELDHCEQLIDQQLQQQFIQKGQQQTQNQNAVFNSTDTSEIWQIVESTPKQGGQQETHIVPLNILPTGSLGQSIQLLDLGPGTYFALTAEQNQNNDFNAPPLSTIDKTLHIQTVPEILPIKNSQMKDIVVSEMQPMLNFSVSHTALNLEPQIETETRGKVISYVELPLQKSVEQCHAEISTPREFSDLALETSSVSGLAVQHIEQTSDLSVVTSTGNLELLSIGEPQCSVQANTSISMLPNVHVPTSSDLFDGYLG